MEVPLDGTRLLQNFKPGLLKALVLDPDFLLQHCHADGILSNNEYNNIKDINTRSRQVRDILDRVIDKGDKYAKNFLELLQKHEIQETFPQLHFLKNQQTIKRKTTINSEMKAKRRLLVNDGEKEQRGSIKSRRISEMEMMKVARCVGNSWKELGIMALGMNTTTLQQIEEDNKLHIERVFAMLRKWSFREREQATATRLYSLLTQEESGVDPQNISFLIENN